VPGFHDGVINGMEECISSGVILREPSAKYPTRSNAMSTFKPISIFFGAVAILWTALALPAAAQQVMSEPAYCAFFYPYANCQNKGPGNPYTDPNYHRNAAHDQVWSSGETVGIAPRRSVKHRSDHAAAWTR
jgi:hypothetical protein